MDGGGIQKRYAVLAFCKKQRKFGAAQDDPFNLMLIFHPADYRQVTVTGVVFNDAELNFRY